jgi:hypothetical protein
MFGEERQHSAQRGRRIHGIHALFAVVCAGTRDLCCGRWVPSRGWTLVRVQPPNGKVTP